MADQKIPDLTADASPADSDQYVVHKSGETRAKKQTRATLKTGLVPTTRTVSTTAPLTGGGDLSGNRTLGISDVGGLSGELADAQKTTVRKNSGANVGSRARLNLIEGSNVTLTVTDDAANGEVDVMIAATGGGAVTERWARARRLTNQAIPATQETVVIFDTEDIDTDTFYDTSNGRATIPAGLGGSYRFGLGIRFSTLSSGVRLISLRLNGTTWIGGSTSSGIPSINTPLNAWTELTLVPGDYVQGIVYSTVAIDVVAELATFFVIRKLA